jgi:hypothetical protein
VDTFLTITTPALGYTPDLQLMVLHHPRCLSACLYQGHQLYGAWITELGPQETIFERLDRWVGSHAIASVHWVEATPWFQLIPPGDFPRDVLAAQFLHLFGPESAHPLETGRFAESDAQAVFALPDAIRLPVQARFSSVKFSHAAQWIGSIPSASKEVLVAIVFPGSFLVGAFRDGKLLFVRAFSFHHPIDAAYHLLSVANTLDMNPEELTLEWMGMVEQKSPLTKACRAYFRNQSFPRHTGWQFPEGTADIPGHFMYHLLTTAECASSVAV